jgi:hypothetical protein
MLIFSAKRKIINKNHSGYDNVRKILNTKALIKFGVIFGVIGSTGYTFVGLFNMDRAGPDGMYHYLFAVVFFGGLITSISIFSFYIFILKGNIPKIYALYGLTIPLLSAILWLVTGILLFEWFTLISILGFLMPFHSRKIIEKMLNFKE